MDDCVWINSETTVIYPVQNINLNRNEKAMTENIKIKTPPTYDHDAVMRLRNAVFKMSGTTADPTYLVCAYLQQAVDPAMYKTITDVCLMSEEEFNKFWLQNNPKGETK